MRSRLLRSALLGAAALGAVSLAGTGVALAGTYGGLFNITVWQGSNPNSGTASDPSQIANTSNSLYLGSVGSELASFQYSGPIDFYQHFGSGGEGNILTFLNYGGGSFGPFSYGSSSALNTYLSSGPYDLTTVIEITGTTNHAISGFMNSDDGSSIYQGLSSAAVAGRPYPHPALPSTAYSFSLNPGAFQILYVEANGLPAELKFNVTSVPEPGSLALLGTGLLGLGLIGRRRRRRKA